MSSWHSHELLAWTRHDGPVRPPRGLSPALLTPLASGLVVVYLGVLATDALCPEHRAWVDGFAGMSTVAAVCAVVGLLRGWASAPLLAVSATLGGVAIGVIDAVHDPARGRVIALLFAALAVASLALAASGLRLRRWQRQSLRPVTTTVDLGVAAAPVAAGTVARRVAEPAGEDGRASGERSTAASGQ